jgi:hypothetical protein
MSFKDQLSTQQKALLRRSSSEDVQDSLASTRRYIKKGRWLGTNNRYRINSIRRLDDDTASGKVNCLHLRQYIAASAFAHCTDGWSFLGRSIDAHSNGDLAAALHFAYYAELRAAMSFLATQGIGIFSKKHYIISTPLSCTLVPKTPKSYGRRYWGTHQITWLALEHWADQAKSSDLLFGIIAPANIKLSDWFQHFHRGAPAPKQLGRKWLKAWGLDLKYLSDDRDARNEVSYRPTDLSPPPQIDALVASQFVSSFWTSFEPSASRFEVADRYLLRASLELAFKGRTGVGARGNAQFEQELDRMLDSLIPPGPKVRWLDFLTGRTNPDNPTLLQFASVDSILSNPMHHLQVICRAALLLRVATGACGVLRSETMLTRADLSFWWGDIGLRRGLWQPRAEPANCSNLWIDIDAAIQDETVWQAANAAAAPSFFKWRTERVTGLSVLAECERIALWGLGL